MGNSTASTKALQQARQGGHLKLRARGLPSLPEEVWDIATVELPDNSSWWETRETLETIDVSQNEIVALPDDFANKLDQLREFNLSHNRLSALPPAQSWCALESLVNLSLGHNQLRALPEHFGHGNAPPLVRLSADHNQIASLPSSLGMLSDCVEIDLSHNALATLPPGLSGLRSLRKLSLAKNRLGALPVDLLAAPPPLVELDLSENRLQSLSLGVPSVTTVLLGNNSLQALELTGCDALQELSAPYNAFAALPSGLPYLPRLATLDVSNNRIALLDELVGCASLTRLDVSCNEVSFVPPRLGNLSLSRLALAGNPLRTMPNHIREAPTPKLLAHLRGKIVDDAPQWEGDTRGLAHAEGGGSARPANRDGRRADQGRSLISGVENEPPAAYGGRHGDPPHGACAGGGGGGYGGGYGGGCASEPPPFMAPPDRFGRGPPSGADDPHATTAAMMSRAQQAHTQQSQTALMAQQQAQMMAQRQQQMERMRQQRQGQMDGGGGGGGAGGGGGYNALYNRPPSGRSDGGRSDGARSDGARSDGARSDGGRSGGGGGLGPGSARGGGDSAHDYRQQAKDAADYNLQAMSLARRAREGREADVVHGPGRAGGGPAPGGRASGHEGGVGYYEAGSRDGGRVGGAERGDTHGGGGRSGAAREGVAAAGGYQAGLKARTAAAPYQNADQVFTGVTNELARHVMKEGTDLCVGGMGLTELPSGGYPETLTRIDASANKLTAVPDALADAVPSLRALDVSKNALTALPVDLSDCAALESLRASQNAIRALAFLQQPLLRLVELHADKNGLSQVPPSLWLCPRLKRVSLYQNKLDLASLAMPGAAGNGGGGGGGHTAPLEHLDLGENKLGALPPLGLFPNLREVHVQQNGIRELPVTQIAPLMQLQTLDISMNDVSSLPPDLARLPLLQNLTIIGNPIRSIPQSVQQRGATAVIDLLRKRLPE